MAKIFIYIFSILAITSILPDSISKKELAILKKNCIKLYNDKNYSDSIECLEKYLSFRNEIQFKIYLAKSILFRTDLAEPKEEDEIFLRQEKIHFALENYRKAAHLFSQLVPELERLTPKDKSLGDLYFLWAFSEYFSENKEKAISLFKKSGDLNPTIKPISNYNIASLFADLGQTKDSQIYFKK